MAVEAHAHLGAANRLSIARFGMWLFMISESMLFVGLLAARFFLQDTFIDKDVDQIIGLVITSILLASSWSAYRAESAIAHNDRDLFRKSLVLTMVLGSVFLAGVVYEWAAALHSFPPHTGFGTIFFVMTGIHAFHVVTGLIFLAIVYRNAQRDRYDSSDYWPAEASVKYWHFVDVVWVFFYPALYLL